LPLLPRSRLRAGALFAIAAVMLAACGGNGQEQAPAAAPTTAAPATAPSTTAPSTTAVPATTVANGPKAAPQPGGGKAIEDPDELADYNGVGAEPGAPTPEGAAVVLLFAWKAGDKAVGSRVASPRANDELFAAGRPLAVYMKKFCTPHPKVAGSRRCLGNTGSETLIDMVVGKTSRGLWLVQDLDVKPGQGWTDADPDATVV